MDGEILVDSSAPGVSEVVAIRPDGRSRRVLTSTGQSGGPAVWSPDGSQVAFANDRDGDFDIYVMNADGTGLRNLTNASPEHDLSPAWSPDGVEIAFSNGFLHLVNADGTSLRSLGVTVYPGPIRWSPDGTRLLYAAVLDCSDDRIFTSEIFTIPKGGGEPRNLTNAGCDPGNFYQLQARPDWKR